MKNIYFPFQTLKTYSLKKKKTDFEVVFFLSRHHMMYSLYGVAMSRIQNLGTNSGVWKQKQTC